MGKSKEIPSGRVSYYALASELAELQVLPSCEVKKSLDNKTTSKEMMLYKSKTNVYCCCKYKCSTRGTEILKGLLCSVAEMGYATTEVEDEVEFDEDKYQDLENTNVIVGFRYCLYPM